MYVDDRAYGWHGADDGKDEMFLLVLESFLRRVCGFSRHSADITKICCLQGNDPEDWMIDGVKRWKNKRNERGVEIWN